MITLQDVLHCLFCLFFLKVYCYTIVYGCRNVELLSGINMHNNNQIITFLIHGHFYDLNKNRKTADESIYF